jgi:hypothetical protein
MMTAMMMWNVFRAGSEHAWRGYKEIFWLAVAERRRSTSIVAKIALPPT